MIEADSNLWLDGGGKVNVPLATGEGIGIHGVEEVGVEELLEPVQRQTMRRGETRISNSQYSVYCYINPSHVHVCVVSVCSECV